MCLENVLQMVKIVFISFITNGTVDFCLACEYGPSRSLSVFITCLLWRLWDQWCRILHIPGNRTFSIKVRCPHKYKTSDNQTDDRHNKPRYGISYSRWNGNVTILRMPCRISTVKLGTSCIQAYMSWVGISHSDHTGVHGRFWIRNDNICDYHWADSLRPGHHRFKLEEKEENKAAKRPYPK